MDIINSQNFIKKENILFFDEYIELLINRLTHANMSLEHDLGEVNNHHNALRLKDNMIAFKLLIKHSLSNEELNEKIIISTANIVNQSAMYISNGYRTGGGYHIVDTSIPISKPSEIEKDMFYLLKNYHENWKDLDPYEREAYFHIGFIRIHPFEDGNGRTGRLILNYNLLKQGLAPVIITTDLEEFYHSYIQNSDAYSMANLFRIQSEKEKEVIEKLVLQYDLKNNTNVQL